jgi:hypothetical protein
MKTTETKKELITRLNEKIKRANPMVKKTIHQDCKYATKAKIKRMANKAHVTTNGDVSFS